MKMLKQGGITWVELGGVGLLMLVVLPVVAVPVWRRARDARWEKACQENLTRIDGAKEQYALEHNKRPGDPVAWSDVVRPGGATGYLKEAPRCPSGHAYTLNAVGTAPRCDSTIEGHALAQICGCTTVTE